MTAERHGPLSGPAASPRLARGATAKLRPALLGASFAVLALVGIAGPSAAKPGLGPRGWTPGELAWHPTSAAVSALLATAYLLGAVGVAVGLRYPPRRALSWRAPLLLAAAALVTQPFGSADHTNYAAYGRILIQGGDPWTQRPDLWHGGTDPVVGAVEPPWTKTPSIYGPSGTALQGLAAWLGGDNVRQVVWVWQLVVVVCWLAVRALLLRLADDPERVDVLWTANPVLFGVGVLGAHVDMVATAAAVATIVLMRRSPWLAGVTGGLAVGTKVTYAVVVVAVVGAWARWGGPGQLRRRLPPFAVAFAVVVLAEHWWAGRHVFDQLARARRSISLATPWRLVLEALRGHVAEATIRTVVFVLSGVVCVALAVALWRLTARLVRTDPPGPGDGRAPLLTVVDGQAARLTFVLGTAYALGAPYSLPWYDQLAWATLPLLGASLLDVVLLGRALVMACAYVPGRVVAMSPRVESVTLGFRRWVAPWATLVAWVVVLAAGTGRRWTAANAGAEGTPRVAEGGQRGQRGRQGR